MKRGLLDLTQNNVPLCRTVPHTCQRSSVPAPPISPAKPHRNEIRGVLPDKRRVPHGWPACLRRQPPRVAFRNNDIYVVDDEEYKEPRERHPKVQYKLRLTDNPAAQNMPHEEDYSNNNYESIDETGGIKLISSSTIVINVIIYFNLYIKSLPP